MIDILKRLLALRLRMIRPIVFTFNFVARLYYYDRIFGQEMPAIPENCMSDDDQGQIKGAAKDHRIRCVFFAQQCDKIMTVELDD